MTKEQNEIDALLEHYGDYLDRENVQIGFPGGFLNFGYWNGISPDPKMAKDQRLDSLRAMYRSVLASLEIEPGDSVLEIASGRGSGCVLALDEFRPAKICGIDILSRQVDRAKRYNANALRKYGDSLQYRVGSGMDIPYPANTFDKVFSVEAFIYFSDLDKFMNEICRVMRRPAKFAASCVFATSPEVRSEDWLHLFDRSGVAKGFAVQNVTSKLVEFGFSEVGSKPIGRHVWDGYREWVSQNFEIENPLPERWYKGYKKGLFDYYLLSAKLCS